MENQAKADPRFRKMWNKHKRQQEKAEMAKNAPTIHTGPKIVKYKSTDSNSDKATHVWSQLGW